MGNIFGGDGKEGRPFTRVKTSIAGGKSTNKKRKKECHPWIDYLDEGQVADCDVCEFEEAHEDLVAIGQCIRFATYPDLQNWGYGHETRMSEPAVKEILYYHKTAETLHSVTTDGEAGKVKATHINKFLYKWAELPSSTYHKVHYFEYMDDGPRRPPLHVTNWTADGSECDSADLPSKIKAQLEGQTSRRLASVQPGPALDSEASISPLMYLSIIPVLFLVWFVVRRLR